MRLRFTYMRAIPFLVLLGAVIPCTGYAEGKFNLKPGAEGKLCLTCHDDFAAQLKKKFVHTPVAAGDCVDCHNPHTADHGKLLAGDVGQVCLQCHDAVVPAKARSVHQPVAEARCTACHDPHAADYKNNLLKDGNTLCLSCHKEMEKQLGALKYPHVPVADNCLNCHTPHASADAKSLLIRPPPALCATCHDTGDKKFATVHSNYPVAKADCTSCHNPHGSNRQGILYDQVHEPVAKGMCSQCHEKPDAPTPLKTKAEGFELCRICHSKLVNDAFGKNHLHSPLMDKRGCLNCHSPHAATRKSLLKGSLLQVCGQCHADTIQRQGHSKTEHPPVKDGDCTACHAVHASDYDLLNVAPTVIAQCGKCHEWQSHSSHPLGDKFVDKRNPNLTLDCLSCHRAHGTEFEHMIPFSTVSNLCVQCHEQFKR